MSQDIHEGIGDGSTVITIAMGKGGAGKSLVAFHTARMAEEHGTVTALDLDRQGHLLDYFGIPAEQRLPHLEAMLMGVQPYHESILMKPASPSERDRIRVISSTEGIAQMDALMFQSQRKPEYLRGVLDKVAYGRFKVLDTPTMGYLSEMAIAAADVLVAPVALGEGDVKALVPFLVRARKLNPAAPIFVVPNRYAENDVAKGAMNEVKAICADFGINRTVRVGNTVNLDPSRLKGRPIWEMKPMRRAIQSAAFSMRSAVSDVLCAAGARVSA